MTKQEKLLKRFLSKPRDFTFTELRKLLRGFGYKEIRSGKTSGSRVVFFNESLRHIIRLHKPHPRNILKRYQLDFIEDELKKLEILK
ncbi:MAG: type II toxin-antitoxin system HicA family toxin [Candidatus Aminicenantes bacterium]|nr:type II toxin-antitoxin system HicA family toxin [Candidatus Aminicenantes bacterium]MDH5386248.1 type II toxin-antitoxin system HicA family toxin [Candidatus Aminicenantes bacterium]